MALQKDWQKKIDGFDSELTAKNAYCKVANVNGSKLELTFEVHIFNSEKQNLIDRKFYSFQPSVTEDSKNFIAQAYEHLKTLPEFENSANI